jgi:hypothetical protein
MRKLRKTEPTELFFGFKNRRRRKTVLLRETSGSLRKSTWETGATTAKKDSVSSTTRMETSMRVCGQLTSATVRELIGEMKIRSSDVSIPAIGSKTKSTVAAPFSTKTEIVTMATG